MEYGENNYAVRVNHEEDLIGESSCKGATDGFIDDWIRFGIAKDRTEEAIYRTDEL
jgi:hypothetical protein